MTPDVAVASVFKQYATFSGRARRSEYWWFFLFNFLAAFAVDILGAALRLPALSFVFAVAVLLPGLAVTVRRFHDVGRSGWWVLTAIIPLVGLIVLLVFTLSDSHPGTNQYGPSPKYPDGAGSYPY